MQRKLNDARESGARALVTACTYCQLQFGSVRLEHLPEDASCRDLPSILFPQLLGTALGLPCEALEKRGFQI